MWPLFMAKHGKKLAIALGVIIVVAGFSNYISNNAKNEVINAAKDADNERADKIRTDVDDALNDGLHPIDIPFRD